MKKRIKKSAKPVMQGFTKTLSKHGFKEKSSFAKILKLCTKMHDLAHKMETEANKFA